MKFNRFFATSSLIATFALSCLTSANAAVVVSLVRESDATALLSIQGSLDTPTNSGTGHRNILNLFSIFSTLPTANDSRLVGDAGGSLMVGSTPLAVAAYAGSSFLYGDTLSVGQFLSDLPAGQPFSGSLHLTLTNGVTFAGAGSTGAVRWDGDFVGTWSMAAAVPEFSEWAMMIAGLGIIGWKARKRRIAKLATPIV